MTEKMNQLMKDVPAIRWTALILLASAMFFGYIFMDILSPLQELLQTSRGWSPDAYGHYTGSETFLNVFVFFLIFAGIILDKMGVRFTAILSGAVMLADCNYIVSSLLAKMIRFTRRFSHIACKGKYFAQKAVICKGSMGK